MTLFEVAIVDEETMLVAPTYVMAKDEKSAILIVGQAHPAIKLKKAKVLVRPFV